MREGAAPPPHGPDIYDNDNNFSGIGVIDKSVNSASWSNI